MKIMTLYKPKWLVLKEAYERRDLDGLHVVLPVQRLSTGTSLNVVWEVDEVPKRILKLRAGDKVDRKFRCERLFPIHHKG